MSRLKNALISSGGKAALLGVLLILVSIQILRTGLLRNIIVLGNAKYFFGGFMFLCGAWCLYQGMRDIIARYRS